MTHAEAAAAYLAIPNTLLQALGGTWYLREQVGASQFEILSSWPAFANMLPFGLSFRFRVGEKSYGVSLCTSTLERNQYSLDIYRENNVYHRVLEPTLTLEQAVAKFFEFAQAKLPS
ncbi:hypothetical protein [Leptolyngbya sp. BC1307]|uniref:hypothetical protein n=1 Tax=Leptolyngbya sp. BC1307 TaxID=2029589 RepID=UPI000EFB2B98|nr:hypothetical protein [Leptolyngbya sp. BC1307]